MSSGRWKISMRALDAYLSEHLKERSFGTSIECFVFCFEIAEFEQWGDFFRASAEYTSYRPKAKEIWSVGQLHWTAVKNLNAGEQLIALRGAVQSAIHRIGSKARKPRDFDHAAFATSVETLLGQAEEGSLVARPAA